MSCSIRHPFLALISTLNSSIFTPAINTTTKTTLPSFRFTASQTDKMVGTDESLKAFFSAPRYAVVGASTNPDKFGHKRLSPFSSPFQSIPPFPLPFSPFPTFPFPRLPLQPHPSNPTGIASPPVPPPAPNKTNPLTPRPQSSPGTQPTPSPSPPSTPSPPPSKSPTSTTRPSPP